MNSDSSSVECPLCGQQADLRTKWVQSYSIYHCSSCKLLFADPIPTDEQLAEYYQGFLYRQPNAERVEKLSGQKRPELISYFGTSDNHRFLDYGAGTGVAVGAALGLGYEVHYYEIDQQAHSFVRDHTGIDPGKMYSDTNEIPKNYFDMILCDNVIEHVPRPKEFLDELMEYLAPNGTLVIKTPNAMNTELYFFPQISIWGYANRAWKFSSDIRQWFRTLRHRTWNCDPPRHLFSFSKESLKQLCDSAGVHDFEFRYYHLPVFEYLMIGKLARRPIPRRLDWPARVVASLFELVAKPFYLLLRKLGRISSSGITLVVKKQDA